jgi:acetyltransferase
VFPVNPKRPSVLGIKAYPNIGPCPTGWIWRDRHARADRAGRDRRVHSGGVKGAIIISAGFKEAGPQGAELERQILEQARAANMRIIGPNCLGVMSPLTGLNATFAQAMARPGRVAFLSQSGALLTAVLDVALREQIGFSAFASLGSMLDVGWGDLIEYLGDDPRTDSIVIYMESVGDARSFLSAARAVALVKPIIVIKAGRTERGAKAAASHTGSLTGSDAVLDAAFERSGVLRVRDVRDIFSLAEVLAKQPRPKGPAPDHSDQRGRAGRLAADALIEGGGELAPISPPIMDALNAFLPGPWSHNNPIDVLGDAPPDRYAKA